MEKIRKHQTLLDLPFDILAETAKYVAEDCPGNRESCLRLTCKLFNDLFTPMAFERLESSLYEAPLRAALALCGNSHLRQYVRRLKIEGIGPAWDYDNDVEDSPGPRELYHKEEQLFATLRQVASGVDVLLRPGVCDLRAAILSELEGHSGHAVYALIILLCPALQHIEIGEFYDFSVSIVARALRARISSLECSQQHTHGISNFQLRTLKVGALESLEFHEWSFLLDIPTLERIEIGRPVLSPLRTSCPSLYQLKSISLSAKVDTGALDFLIRQSPRLRELSICYELSDHAISMPLVGDILRRHCPPLKWLHLNSTSLSGVSPEGVYEKIETPLGDLSCLRELEQLVATEADLFGRPDRQERTVSLCDILPASLHELVLWPTIGAWLEKPVAKAQGEYYDAELLALSSNPKFDQLRRISISRVPDLSRWKEMRALWDDLYPCDDYKFLQDGGWLLNEWESWPKGVEWNRKIPPLYETPSVFDRIKAAKARQATCEAIRTIVPRVDPQ